MGKQITRRVVLGTVIGGLAVTPFVIRALRGPQTAKINGAYEEAWEQALKKFQIPIKNVMGPKEITLRYNPQVMKKYTLSSLNGVYNERSEPAVFPQPPCFFMQCFGEIQTKKINDTLPIVLEISLDKMVSRGRHMDNSLLIDACCLVVPDDNDFSYFEEKNKAIKKMQKSEINQSCVLAIEVLFGYPRNQILRLGSTWILPAEENMGVDISYVFDGFVSIYGNKAAKFKFESRQNNEDVLASITKAWELSRLNKQNDQAKIDAIRSKEMKVAKEAIETRSLSSEIFVDLETGLLCRQYFKSTLYKNDFAEVVQTSTSFFQVSEC